MSRSRFHILLRSALFLGVPAVYFPGCAAKEASDSPSGLTVNGARAEGAVSVADDEVRLAVSGVTDGRRMTIADADSGLVWYSGPAAGYKARTLLLRGEPLALSVAYTDATGVPLSTGRITLSPAPEAPALYPGVLAEVLRLSDDKTKLPAASEVFTRVRDRVKSIAPFPYPLDGKYALAGAGYPPFRTGESVLTPDFSDLTKPWYALPDYYHDAIPSLAVTPDDKARVAMRAYPRPLPSGDLDGARNVAALFTGLIDADISGDYVFKVSTTAFGSLLKVGDVAGDANGELRLHAAAGLKTFSLAIVRKAGGPAFALNLLWKRPGDADFSPVPESRLFHDVDVVRRHALAMETNGFAYRRASIVGRDRDDAVDELFYADAPGSFRTASAKELAARLKPLVAAFLSGKKYHGDPKVAARVFALVRARLDTVRSDPKQTVAGGGFGQTDGDMLVLFESLRPFLTVTETHPLLREASLSARADLAQFAVATCLGRSFFAEYHNGTNDGYGDHNNLLVNFWRAAEALDDPYCRDAATCQMDTHFRYSSGTGDSLGTDGIFNFHNANGRHIHMGGYGRDWMSRVIGAGRLSSPWGYTPEQYRRLAEYVSAYEWFYYKGTTPFTANGRHNGHAGDVSSLRPWAARLAALPDSLSAPDVRTTMSALVKRIDTLGEQTIATGTRFFYRNLYTVHRRPDFFIDVKMISPLAGPPETFAGAFFWNMNFGDGSTTLMRDAKEYAEIHRNNRNGAIFALRGGATGAGVSPEALSLWRYRELPGTTMSDDEAYGFDRYRTGTGTAAGGVSDGELGHCAFHFSNPAAGAEARKFYAFTDDGMIVMNAGVNFLNRRADPGWNPKPGIVVRSNINQCDLRTDVLVIGGDGKTETIPSSGPSRRLALPLTQPYAVMQDGVAYLVFPTGNEAGDGGGEVGARDPIQADRRALNSGAGTLELEVGESKTTDGVPGFDPLPEKAVAQIKAAGLERSAKLFRLSIDHGPRPRNASCVYFVCMRPDPAMVAKWLKTPPFAVLSNVPDLQALTDLRDGVTHAFFRGPGELKTSGGKLLFTSPTALSLMWRPATRSVTVQDPVAACTRDKSLMLRDAKATLGPGLSGLSGPKQIDVPLPGRNDPDDRYCGRPVTLKVE